jgi:hypothetical protein
MTDKRTPLGGYYRPKDPEAGPRGVGPQAPETERGAYGPPVREIAGQLVTSVNGQQVIVRGGACGM